MRDLTTPITTLAANKQYVSEGKYKLILDGTGNIDMSKSYYQYIVTNIPSGEFTPFEIKAVNLPASFKAKLKEIHNMVVSHAEVQNILLPGVDVDDL